MPAEAGRPDPISDRIVDAILAGRRSPVAGRRSPVAWCLAFGVWRLAPGQRLGEQALATGLLHGLNGLNGPLPAAALARLKTPIADEQAAIRAGNAGERSGLRGDFHVCLAECAGNSLLADNLKDLPAPTTPIATRYQRTHNASESCAEHAQIIATPEAGDLPLPIAQLRAHTGSVTGHLGQQSDADDPLAWLRAALGPRRSTLFTRLDLSTDPPETDP